MVSDDKGTKSVSISLGRGRVVRHKIHRFFLYVGGGSINKGAVIGTTEGPTVCRNR